MPRPTKKKMVKNIERKSLAAQRRKRKRLKKTRKRCIESIYNSLPIPTATRNTTNTTTTANFANCLKMGLQTSQSQSSPSTGLSRRSYPSFGGSKVQFADKYVDPNILFGKAFYAKWIQERF